MTTDTKIDAGDLKLTAAFSVTHKPGAVCLDKYPLLAYAPLQESHDHPDFATAHDPLKHGAAIRTEDRGILVSDIVAKAVEQPDYGQLAEHFGTTESHVRQAITYAIAASTPKGE